MAGSILGTVVWYRNVGTAAVPELAGADPVRVARKGAPPKPEWNWWDPEDDELVEEWRFTPVVIDLDGDGINDLVSVDHEGYLA